MSVCETSCAMVTPLASSFSFCVGATALGWEGRLWSLSSTRRGTRKRGSVRSCCGAIDASFVVGYDARTHAQSPTHTHTEAQQKRRKPTFPPKKKNLRKRNTHLFCKGMPSQRLVHAKKKKKEAKKYVTRNHTQPLVVVVVVNARQFALTLHIYKCTFFFLGGAVE
jgi:hypothetical protein